VPAVVPEVSLCGLLADRSSPTGPAAGSKAAANARVNSLAKGFA